MDVGRRAGFPLIVDMLIQSKNGLKVGFVGESPDLHNVLVAVNYSIGSTASLEN